MKTLIALFLLVNLAACSSGTDTAPTASVTVSNDPDPAINNGLFTLNMKGLSSTYDFKIFYSLDNQSSNSDIEVAYGDCELIPGCENNLFVADLFWRGDNTMSINTTNTGTDISALITALPADGFMLVEFCYFAEPNNCYTASSPITLY